MDAVDKPEKGLLFSNKVFLTIIGTLIALLFITLLIVINIATQVDDIDEKLKYTPPQPKAAKIPPESVVAGQMVYVPVYSHIYAKGGKPFLLEATLSVRNADMQEGITVTSVRYYDTKGNLIKDYLETPMLLKSLETAEFLVPQKDIKGGSGANFIVEWLSETKVNKPVIEAVMIGTEDATSISFVRTGIAIEKQ